MNWSRLSYEILRLIHLCSSGNSLNIAVEMFDIVIATAQKNSHREKSLRLSQRQHEQNLLEH